MRFVATTGEDFHGDAAVDDVRISPWFTPAPTATLVPTASPLPTSAPTTLPTPAPTTEGVTTGPQLQVQVQSSDITVALGADILLTDTIGITGVSGLVVDGRGHRVLGSNAFVCFKISGDGTEVSLLNMTISGGKSGTGGGVSLGLCRVQISWCVIEHNAATLNGGGIFASSEAVGAISDSVIASNMANNGGGAYADFSASLAFVRTLFLNNTAPYGGGINAGKGSLFLLTMCSFYGNHGVFGGAVFVHSANLFVNSTMLRQNTATRSGGAWYIDRSVDGLPEARVELFNCTTVENYVSSGPGGGFAIFGGDVVQDSSMIANNVANGPDFIVDSGPCTASGGCFYSPNFPGEYYVGPSAGCIISVHTSGSLVVDSFSSIAGFGVLRIGSLVFSGLVGPTGVSVDQGDEITWTTAPTNLASSGFKICFDAAANGGGIVVIGGKSVLSNCVVSNNTAHRDGNAIFVDGGESVVADTSVSNSIYVKSGTFEASTIRFEADGGIEGPSAGAAVCSSPCPPGTYGDCSSSAASEKCFFNCLCSLCPAGRSSSAAGETSMSACSLCGPGQYSAVGAQACQSCSVGKFATDLDSDEGGGLTTQVTEGAKFCVDCPAGTYSGIIASIVCIYCDTGKTSSKGSQRCTLAAEGYYFLDEEPDENTEPKECPSNALCVGGHSLPRPNEHHYIDRGGDIGDAVDVLTCVRLTCTGSLLTNISTDRCWEMSWYTDSNRGNDAECAAPGLECREGSRGPLCGSCEPDYKFVPSLQVCELCSTFKEVAVASSLVLIVLIGAFATAWALNFRLPSRIKRWWIVGSLKQLGKGGVTRTVYANYQIIGSISSNLNVAFPAPYNIFQRAFDFLSFDLLALKCHIGVRSPLTATHVFSIVPILLGLCIWVSFVVQDKLLKDRRGVNIGKHKALVRAHVEYFLWLGFILVPSVLARQFKSFECLRVNETFYMKLDTSQECYTRQYYGFILGNAIFVAVYSSMPLVWAAILYRKRHRLNSGGSISDRFLDKRKNDAGLKPLRFLWVVYKPSLYYFESIEMYRRVMFVSVLPLISADAARCAAAGVFLALMSTFVYRELSPFLDGNVNILAVIAQYTVLLTYGSVLALKSDLSKNVDPLTLAIGLLATNTVVLVVALGLSVSRHMRDERTQFAMRKVLDTAQFEVVQEIMKFGHVREKGEHQEVVDQGVEMTEMSAKPLKKQLSMKSNEALLAQHILDPSGVTLGTRIGVGSFGEVRRAIIPH